MCVTAFSLGSDKQERILMHLNDEYMTDKESGDEGFFDNTIPKLEACKTDKILHKLDKKYKKY